MTCTGSNLSLGSLTAYRNERRLFYVYWKLLPALKVPGLEVGLGFSYEG